MACVFDSPLTYGYRLYGGQDKIMRYHYDFIRQAMDILDEAHGSGKEECQGFVWQCENYWQIANFYEMADEKSCKKLEHYLATGEIGLSGNYLNMTELVSRPALDEALNEMEAYGARIGHPITAGMCADINGMAWGYGDALYEHGVRYFYSALHTHHGMFPLYRKMMPFLLGDAWRKQAVGVEWRPLSIGK